MFVQHRGRATHEERKLGADLNYLMSLLMMLSFLPEVCSFHITMPDMHRGVFTSWKIVLLKR